jgi:diguanylate cyclase (GGDEF)-like protein
MRRRVHWIALAASLLVVLAVWLAFGRSPRQGGGGEVLRVGMYENPPKIYTDAGGHPAGLFVELLDAVAAREGWRVRYETCLWDDCLRRLEAGQLDLMPDVAYSPQRDRRFDFADVPVAYTWSQVYGRHGRHVRTLADLAHLRVALVRNGIQQVGLDRILRGLGVAWTPVLVDSYAKTFEAVQRGTADVAVVNSFFGAREAHDYGLDETPVLFDPESLYFATTKGSHARELARIDYWLGRWQREPSSVYFLALRHAQVPAPVAHVLPSWLSPVLGLAVGLILLLLAFSVLLRWRVRLATRTADGLRAQMELVLEASPVVLFLAHEAGGKRVADWVSSNVARLYGYAQEQVLEPDWWRAHVHSDDLPLLESAQEPLRGGEVRAHEYRLRDGFGMLRHLHETVRALDGDPAAAPRVLITWNDLSEAKAHAAELVHMEHYDSLTGLPNRQLLRLFLDDATRAGEALAVAWVDLDRLRGINDTLGHAVGDQALRVAAQRLQERLPPRGFLARSGGDEFAVVLPGDGGAAMEAYAREVQASFTRPLLMAAQPVVVTASFGIALHPQDGADSDALLRNAELALYEAKRHGTGRWQRYAPALATGANQRMALESGLRMAVAQRELRLHYQPQVDLRDGSLAGVEALLRWQHPSWGLVPPEQFIALAEETGLIEQLGHWALVEACRQLRAWDDVGLMVPVMGVNCSVQQLDIGKLPAQVADVLAATGLPAHRLELEITESMLMKEPARAIEVLQALRARGVRLAIDDFGTGYSSLAYLQRLPMSRLKIDRAFVCEIDGNPGNQQICRSVIELARSLGLETLAEGVERVQEADFLRESGCALAQGYLYARPMPVHELVAWMRERQVHGEAVPWQAAKTRHGGGF